MIARVWTGRTPARLADEYLDYLDGTGVATCRTTPGNLGVQVLRRLRDDEAEFVFISYWESYEAIRRFAGPEPERARYFPEDERYLLELDPHVHHYEVARAAEPGPPPS